MAIKVKICGVSTEETLDAAVAGGATHIGFNFFPKSPRSVQPERAAALVRRLPPHVTPVALVVNEDRARIDAIRTQKVKDMMPKDPVVLPREPNRGGATRSSAPTGAQPAAAAPAELRKQPSRVAVAAAPAAAAV